MPGQVMSSSTSVPGISRRNGNLGPRGEVTRAETRRETLGRVSTRETYKRMEQLSVTAQETESVECWVRTQALVSYKQDPTRRSLDSLAVRSSSWQGTKEVDWTMNCASSLLEPGKLGPRSKRDLIWTNSHYRPLQPSSYHPYTSTREYTVPPLGAWELCGWLCVHAVSNSQPPWPNKTKITSTCGAPS